MEKPTTQRAYHDRRFSSLRGNRAPWEGQWQELADYNAPHRLRFTAGQNQGKKLRSKIIDSSGSFALRTLASGMHSGITSPARPWFRMGTNDPELREFGPVREYLAAVEVSMRAIFQASNIYNAFHVGYGDLGLFGQSCALLVQDRKRVIRMIPLLHGSFWLGRNGQGVADTLYRQVSWSVEKIVERFGLKNCSKPIQDAYDKGDYDQPFLINHAVEPRHDRQFGKLDKRNKPFLSNYWEDGGRAAEGGKMLEESGFDMNPIIAPPWELVAEDNYSFSPGQETLPDVKMLQSEQFTKGEAIQKKVRPPMKGPTSMRNNPASLMPGSVTYVDDPTGRGFTPSMEVNLSLNELGQDIREVRQRIERGYYADLFLMLANMEGIQPRNNMEIMERKEEKLLALGPVLENIYGGQLAPTIENTYAAMAVQGKLPPPPPEIENQALKIEYISVLAQAQKAISTGSIERLWSFAGNISAAKPEVLDKLDGDQTLDVYAELVGADPELILSDDKVAKLRQDRAKAQAEQAQTENAIAMAPALKDGADAARVLSEADAQGGSILDDLGIR